MVQNCVVLGCRSEWSPGCGLSFHAFPSDPIRRNQWLSIVPLKHSFYETAKICSLHFKNTDYVGLGKRLKTGATPFYKENTTSDAENVLAVKTPQVLDILQGDRSQEYLKIPKRLEDAENTPPLKKPRLLGIIKASTSRETAGFQEENQAIKDVENIPPFKKPLLLDILEASSSRESVGQEEIQKILKEKNEKSKIKKVADKSVQAKIKTPREESLQKRNNVLVQKVFRLNKSVNNLKSLVNIVKSYTSNSEIENILNGNFENICKEFKKSSTVSHGIRYSEEVKAFALTLHFYSAKAYDFLRQYVALPHVETLRRALSSFNCNVGFLTEVFKYLKCQVIISEKNYLKNVSLIFDGMAIKQDLSYDPKLDKVFGYVDLGQIQVSDSEELASEALVFQIVSYTTYFKCPIGYFFIKNSLAGELLAELLKTAVIMLEEIGITVRSMTCDGASSNLKAYQHLGVSLDHNDFRPYFPHPNGRNNIYCFLDAAHMLKLARNVLAEFPIKSSSGQTSFKYIRELHNIQKEEGLKFGNKLTHMHVEYQNKKMNVKLAAQVLSSSVADAIDFLRISGNPDFSESEATVEFLRMFDRVFDLMNSKSPFGRGFKSPLSLKNKSFWEPIFTETKEYLKSLSIAGKNILNTGRKTFALGFLINITNFPSLLQDLSRDPNNPIKYLLTFKCSQDNLEIFFSCIRARGRTQDNPNPLEFRYRMRKLLYRNSIQPSIHANCIDHSYESSHVFDNYGQTHEERTLLETTKDQENTEELEEKLQALDSDQACALTDYQLNIMYYITGYIVKQILIRQKCEDCKKMLIASDNSQSDHFYSLNINKYQTFSIFINRGKLHFPSKEAFSIVQYADKIFKSASIMEQLNRYNVKNKMINMVHQHFTPKLQQMFSHPISDSINCTDLHESKIVKLIAHSYLSMRLRTHLKRLTDEKLSVIRTKRQKLHKTIIFSHI